MGIAVSEGPGGSLTVTDEGSGIARERKRGFKIAVRVLKVSKVRRETDIAQNLGLDKTFEDMGRMKGLRMQQPVFVCGFFVDLGGESVV